jgi:phage gp36-like protein
MSNYKDNPYLQKALEDASKIIDNYI